MQKAHRWKGGSLVGGVSAQDSGDLYSVPLQGRLSTWTQESDNFSAHPIIGVQQRVARQQQQYLDKHPEEGKEARFPLGRESKSLGKNMPQWLKDHTWKAASPGSGSTRAHLPPRKQRGAWGHPPTHTALKFYTEGHHVGAKRFYGYTFGLHIGVLGGGVGGTSCKRASASSLGELLIW